MCAALPSRNSRPLHRLDDDAPHPGDAPEDRALVESPALQRESRWSCRRTAGISFAVVAAAAAAGRGGVAEAIRRRIEEAERR